MKRKLFVGSSSEGIDFAKQVVSQINKVCGDWIEAQTWCEGNIFNLNTSTLESLFNTSRRFDYGILIASKDDVLESRNAISYVPRDNVMFEMGMFLGSLGLTRAYLLVEEESKLPTDYNGVTVSYFQRDLEGSLEKAITKIVNAVKVTKNTFNLKPTPSTTLAVGYFLNFVQPLARKRLKDNKDFKLKILLPQKIENIEQEIQLYKNNNPSKGISVYGDKQRPIVNELEAEPSNFWDIPSTLKTLSNLMDILLHSKEVGINQEKQDWIEHELRNFAGALEMMTKGCPACKGNVEIKFL